MTENVYKVWLYSPIAPLSCHPLGLSFFLCGPWRIFLMIYSTIFSAAYIVANRGFWTSSTPVWRTLWPWGNTMRRPSQVSSKQVFEFTSHRQKDAVEFPLKYTLLFRSNCGCERVLWCPGETWRAGKRQPRLQRAGWGEPGAVEKIKKKRQPIKWREPTWQLERSCK